MWCARHVYGLPFRDRRGSRAPDQLGLRGHDSRQASDTIVNINGDALDQMSDAAAAAVITLAQSKTSINGVGGNGSFMAGTAREMATGPAAKR